MSEKVLESEISSRGNKQLEHTIRKGPMAVFCLKKDGKAGRRGQGMRRKRSPSLRNLVEAFVINRARTTVQLATT